MDIFADEQLLNIGGFNLLHYALKKKFQFPIIESFITVLNNRQTTHQDINFFYPAQNPKFHMCSPNKILENTVHFKGSRKILTSMLQTAQKTQEEQNAYTDGDSDTDSDGDHSDAYIWKHVLLDMIDNTLYPPLPKEEGKYVVPLFHGVPFMTNLYTHADRKYVGKKMMLLNPSLTKETKNVIEKHLNIQNVNPDLKAIYSRTSTASAGVANMTVIAQDDAALTTLNTLKEKNVKLKEDLIEAYKADISNKKAVFQGIVLDFVNQFQDEDGATQKKVWDKITNLNNNLNNEIVKYRFPFISTSKTPDHAVPYGFGLRLESTRGEGRLDPEYDNTGYPKHRLAGLVYVIQEDATSSLETLISSGEIFDVCSLKRSDNSGVSGQIGNQIEIAYLAGVDADKVIATIPLVYPNFAKPFMPGYHDIVYGCDQKSYEMAANVLTAKKPIDQKEQEDQAKAQERALKNMWIKYIEKIADKFIDGQLVTLLSQDDKGKFELAEYDLTTPYNITGGNTGIECSVSPTHRIVTGTCNYDNNQEKGIARKIVKDLTFDGQGMVENKKLNYWHTYTNVAMDNILKLRLESGVINKDIDIFSPSYVFDGSNSSATKLSKDISEKIDDTLLVNLNLYNKHWVGIAIDKSNNEINLHYMDPEQQEMPVILKEQLENTLIEVYPYHQISLVEDKFEAQKHNNCGPEVIENFMFYLTNHRLSQEDALPVHSLLFEDTVMLEGNYISCI